MQALLLLFTLLASGNTDKNTEDTLWSSYQKILDIGIQKNSYTAKFGKFTHNAFDYKKLLAHKDYHKLVQGQRTELIEASTPTNRYDKLAFWINAYNFFTLVEVTENYPVDSMKDIGWKKARHNVGGKKYSLDEIEHKILRPMNEPKIHFAINCASVSCPSLHDKVFQADDVGVTLKNLTENAFRNPLHIQLDGDGIEVTKIFSWFGKDFEIHPFKEKENFIKRYAAKKLHKEIDGYLNYNWDLNNPENVKEAMQKLGLTKE
ncbi:MAG: DUF547 domain-containing protein [Lentisphaeraceae bacterium]|nr:DUF547 domain-containing protein [Lentisphaeraceae bacterium]